MPDSQLSDAAEYSRRLFERIIDWYKNADAKAQIILTLDGAFVTFLTTSIFRNPDDLSRITHRFTSATWLFLVIMCVCLAGSILCALMCLWSRVFLSPKRDKVLLLEKKRIAQASASEGYSPSVMLFFRTICWLDHDKFQEQLLGMDQEFAIRAFASQSYLLSRRVYVKHLLIDFGFALAGLGLIFFLAAGISYLAASL